MTEPKCLCGIDHQKQIDLAEQFRNSADALQQFADAMNQMGLAMAAQLEPMVEAIRKIADILTPPAVPPYDPICQLCLASTALGGNPCPYHAPPPPFKIKNRQKKNEGR